MRAKIVSSIFARAADRHLNNHGGKRRQNEHEYRADDAETATAAAIAASEEHGKLRKHGNGASNGSGYRHCQRVVITHMAQFVTDDAGDFVAAQRVEEPRRRANRSMLRIASGGESIGLWTVH